MDGQPRRDRWWLSARVALQSSCRSGGAASNRWRTRGAKAKDKIMELRNRGFCGAREASSSPCDHLHWGFGSRAAGQAESFQWWPAELPSIGHLGPSARRSKFDSRFFIILVTGADFRGATLGGYTAIRYSKSEEIIDGRRRELRARAGAGPTPRSAQVYGINTGRTLRSLIPPYRLT